MENNLQNYIENITYEQVKDFNDNLNAFSEFYTGNFEEKFSGHFYDIFNNLSHPINMATLDEKIFDMIKVKFLQPALISLTHYITLFKKYEEFRKGEFYGEEGAFPDLSDIKKSNGTNRHKTYIMRSKKRLKDEIGAEETSRV